MASRQFHFKSFSIVKGDVKVNIDLSRFQGQYREAQYALDSAVMASMTQYMPMDTSALIDNTKAMSASLAGTGTVVAAAPPYGRMQYEGKVMVDSVTGKGPMKVSTGPGEYVWRYRKGAKLVASDRPLKYSNPKATPHWFDTAKENHGDKWVKVVKKIAGGGSK